MDNRDKIIEDQMRNSNEMIPESLRPDNIEKKLASMTIEERYKRSQSEDIPSEVTAKPKKGKGKVVIPLVLAASLLTVFGIGVALGVSGNRKVNDDNTPGIFGKKDNDKDKDKDKDKGGLSSIFGGDDENYDEVYSYFKAYKDHMDNIVYEDVVDYEMVESADEAPAGDSAKSDSSSSRQNLAGTTTAGTYEEEVEFTDTNVRTEGVAEADIVKTDGKYIYEYDSMTEHLVFYSVKDGEIKKEGTVNVLEDDYHFIEMYIYGDKLVLVGTESEASSYYWYDNNASTYVAVYDISDKGDPELEDTFVQAGGYYTSRMVDGKLYTFSKKTFNVNDIEKKDYETYIPEVDGELVDNDDVYIQKDTYNTTFVVLTSIDIDKLKYVDKMAVLGGSNVVYVSANNIYLTDMNYNWVDYTYKDETLIARISYDDGKMEFESKGHFPGYLNDDYSIDEYDGNIRLVTTYRDADYQRYNALYVLDEELSKVSVIKKLAEGESIKSARFMGETAYFVTFKNRDPLFAVDLSDPENPRVTDYLKIPGFSAYLHPYGENRLLGIGYDANEENGWTKGLKLTMFDTSDPYDIKELDTMLLNNYSDASVLQDRNAFMFNGNDGTFGISAVSDWGWLIDDDYSWAEEYYGEDFVDSLEKDMDGSYYMVFDYEEGKGFETKMNEKLDENIYSVGMNDVRGIVIGDYLYVVSTGVGIKSYDTTDYELVNECD